MKLDELETRMRVFETAHDHAVLPGIYMVARLDGRSFTRLTREILALDAPYDEHFRDCMIAALRHLMECGFGVVYGYTQSDEISLLFRQDANTFGRKLRKLESILAGEASAAFTHALGRPAAFDGRISQLPAEADVVDYFRWRQEDAHRNALSGHCYWLLRSEGRSDREATEELEGASVAARNELLFQRGVVFDALPSWQKRGSAPPSSATRSVDATREPATSRSPCVAVSWWTPSSR
ncbi:MAG: guanylyltransferase [Sandaracinaceae bacterium]|nr:guanylyltransferase [Sandaracinaceae bacterium]